jgi:predicted ATP-grasp superfamily ATP-dependent carboligase
MAPMAVADSPLRILVTDGDNRAALAVTRSLGRLGHHVAVGEKHSPALAQTSRYCRERLTSPDPAKHDEAFVDWLERTVRSHKIDVLLPLTDITTILVTRHRRRFDGQCRVPFASADTIERAANKADVVRTAGRLGVPIPQTVFLETAGDLDAHRSALSFPVVVKPSRSRVRTTSGWTSTSVSYARDLDELRREVGRRPAHEYPLLLQERVVGSGVGVFACYREGAPVAFFSHRRLREKPPTGGVSVLSESIRLCPVSRGHAERLLTELRWHGVAMVEFKKDERDGLPKLMEINGRFWGSLQLAIDAGVDFPKILLDTLGPSGEPPAADYRVGVRNRWLWGDLDSLLITLRTGHGAPGRGRLAGGLRAVGRFLKFWEKDLYYENPRLSDLRPWFYETAQWFRRLV